MSSNDNFNKGFQEESALKTFVDKLNKEIEINLKNEQFGVDSLAQSVGMSRSNLHRKLNKLLNTSTSRFIREYRLKRALEILRQEDITASEASYQVGFGSPTYFNTCFHKFYGFTPGEVKLKNSVEFERYISDENILVVKKNPKNKLLWTLLFVPLLLGIFYFSNLSIGKNEESKKSEFIIDEKSIAVLPFKNLTGSPELEYISDGMTDAVTSRLTKIKAINRVIPFTSVLQYKQEQKTVEQIAKELQVENILQGNLQISGDQIKINLQLIHGRSNVHLWSEEYTKEWKSDEIFKIQSEVVEAVARNMQASISDYEMTSIQKIPTKNKQAYSYYLQAEYQRNKANESAYKNAIELYQKAIAIDSNFVEAYANEARVWSFGGLVWGIFDQRTAWDNARRLLQKALEIEPNNKGVEEELYSGYFFYDWNFKLVEPYYQEILKGSYHDDTPSINADYAIKTGRYKEAIIAMDTLILTNPSFGPAFCFKAEALMFLGRTDEAIKLLESTSSLFDDHWFYLRESTKYYFYLGEHEKSRNQLHRLLTKFSDYPPILMWLNATYAQMEGDLKSKDTHLAELFDAYNNGSSGSPAWFLAMYYCTLKDYNQAFKWLQKSYEKHEVEMTWLREEPLLAPIRNDPRYKDLYQKVGFSSIGLPVKKSSEIYFSK